MPSSSGGCQSCMSNQFSSDGSTCQTCPSGSGVTDSGTGLNIGCARCRTETFSPDGSACRRCPAGKEPNEGQTACLTTTNSVEGYSTYRVAAHVEGDALNIYTIYGSDQHET